MLQLTEVNVSKRTTPYLSPEPVLVPNSQLHASNLSLSQWENTDIKIKQTNIQTEHHRSSFTTSAITMTIS